MAGDFLAPVLLEGNAAYEGEDDSRDEVPSDKEARDPEGGAEAFDEVEDTMIEKEERRFGCDGGCEVECLYSDRGLRLCENKA